MPQQRRQVLQKPQQRRQVPQEPQELVQEQVAKQVMPIDVLSLLLQGLPNKLIAQGFDSVTVVLKDLSVSDA